MPRLFISHSSKDNVEALAFRRWLVANGWAESDVFIDLHGIGAGERWRETLRKANAACEAVVLLASPHSLGSVECEKELELAEALGKTVIPAILRELKVKDRRLARWSDRQIVDLSGQPAEPMDAFEHEGQLHRVAFNVGALATIKARLADLGIAPGSFAWEPRGKSTGPYPGLAAFGEQDAGIFFGREADIVNGIAKLRLMRKRRSPRLLVIQAASGSGKSSFLRAGLWPRLKRDPDFAPLAILRPAQGILTGPDGIGQRIAPWFERHRRLKVPGDIEASLMQPDRAGAVSAFSGLLCEATRLATSVRRAGVIDSRPPAPVIAVDQGEEIFAAENAAESNRFLDLLAAVLNDLPEDVDPYILFTIRADCLEPLLQRWPSLGLAVPESHLLPPLSHTAYRDVITKPAEVYSSRVRPLAVEPALADKLAHDATGGDALPLLAFTLEKLFGKFGVDGNLTLQRYEGMGGIGGSIDRALADAQREAGATGTDEHLRRLMVPGLATWDPAAGAAKRRVARVSGLLSGERAALAPLADALVANRLLTRGADTLEVAHEALLRRKPIDGWLEEQKDALKLRDDVIREAEEWLAGGRHRKDLVRTTKVRLREARAVAARADFKAAMAPAKAYLAACRRNARERKFVVGALAASVVAVVALGLGGWLEMNRITLHAKVLANHYGPQRLLTAAQESTLKPGDSLQECYGCPQMVVLPAGGFTMGVPDTRMMRDSDERPQRTVAIAQPLAVGRFEVTFDEWDTCVAHGGCTDVWIAFPFGRGRQPVINVNWHMAQKYVDWLSKQTGKRYRLLTEAEWEYAARAGSRALFSFGDDEAELGEHAWFDANSGGRAHVVGEKDRPNAFGLHDLHGNVWEWVEDCYASTYDNAPMDGTAANDSENCSRVVRGGSWFNGPRILRAGLRLSLQPGNRDYYLGFRVARTLSHQPH